MALLAAANDERVSAVVAMSGWGDLLDALDAAQSPSLTYGRALIWSAAALGRPEPEMFEKWRQLLSFQVTDTDLLVAVFFFFPLLFSSLCTTNVLRFPSRPSPAPSPSRKHSRVLLCESSASNFYDYVNSGHTRMCSVCAQNMSGLEAFAAARSPARPPYIDRLNGRKVHLLLSNNFQVSRLLSDN